MKILLDLNKKELAGLMINLGEEKYRAEQLFTAMQNGKDYSDKINMPKTLLEVGKYTVLYSDTDQNKHMNNTRYPDMYSNFLPLKNKRIDEITISYLNEAASGERLTIEGASVGDRFYIRSIKENGKVNTEAELHLTDI